MNQISDLACKINEYGGEAYHKMHTICGALEHLVLHNDKTEYFPRENVQTVQGLGNFASIFCKIQNNIQEYANPQYYMEVIKYALEQALQIKQNGSSLPDQSNRGEDIKFTTQSGNQMQCSIDGYLPESKIAQIRQYAQDIASKFPTLALQEAQKFYDEYFVGQGGSKYVEPGVETTYNQNICCVDNKGMDCDDKNKLIAAAVIAGVSALALCVCCYKKRSAIKEKCTDVFNWCKNKLGFGDNQNHQLAEEEKIAKQQPSSDIEMQNQKYPIDQQIMDNVNKEKTFLEQYQTNTNNQNQLQIQ